PATTLCRSCTAVVQSREALLTQRHDSNQRPTSCPYRDRRLQTCSVASPLRPTGIAGLVVIDKLAAVTWIGPTRDRTPRASLSEVRSTGIADSTNSANTTPSSLTCSPQ